MNKTYRSGVGFPSYAASATFAVAAGFTSDASYPVTNLGDKRAIRAVAAFVQPAVNPVTTPSWAFTAILPQAQPLQLFALVHHTLPAKKSGSVLAQGGQFRIVLFSDANPDPVGNAAHIVWDSGRQDTWPTTTGPLRPSLALPYSAHYPACRPYILQRPITARSVYCALYPDSGTSGETYDIGAFEIAGWWPWPDVQDDRALGVDSRSQIQAVAGNIDLGTQVWAPRAISGSRKKLSLAGEVDATAVDFAQQQGVAQPFVYVDDADDAASWGRLCFLARNKSLPAATVDDAFTGTFSFDLVEHLG